jgi:tRNA 2-thiouridine synthesizing protein C
MHMPKKILLVIKNPPYGSLMAAEGLRIATALVAMDILPQLVFIDDGVYCLVKDQKPENAGLNSFYERLKALADLIGVYAEENSFMIRNLKTEDLDETYHVKMMPLKEVAKLVADNEVAIAF